jgi:Cu2+-containing amine oxidase
VIRPRFGFDAVASSCVCNRHHHHAYWRLDFDIETPGNNRIREFNNPPIIPGTNWHTKSYEIMRLRAPNRRWVVENSASGRGYAIVPGGNDGTAAGDPYATGDLWFLRYHPNEIDDAPISGTEIQIDKYKNGESLVNQDSVVWYGAHFTHDVAGPPVDHVVGPDLIPQNW